MRAQVLVLGALLVGCTGSGSSSSSSSTGGAPDAAVLTDAGLGDGPLLVDVPTTTCTSGKQWSGGQRSSALMLPGSDCVGCHATTAGAPRLLMGGTVYRGLHEPDDCAGLEGARVRITDNDGTMYQAVTNAAGNFYVLADAGTLSFPYHAVVFGPDGGIRGMVSPQSTAACGSCHTRQGDGTVPGRITSP